MHSTVRLSIAAILSCAAFGAFAANKAPEYEIPYQVLHDTCSSYLENCVPKSDVDQLAKKLERRVKQRTSDNPDQSDDIAMRSLMLDWAAGANKDLENKKPDAVRQAAYYFVIFFEKGFDVPHQIKAQMSEENVREILDYLNEEIAKVTKTAKKK
jgi:hypothetical protein